MKFQALNLKKTFGKNEVVKDISLEVVSGEIVGLLGPNGAGKTTTFYMLTGIEKVDEGEIKLDSEIITMYPLYKRARLGIIYLPQEPSVFQKLNVWENLDVVLEFIYKKEETRNEVIEASLEEMGLLHLKNQKTALLSGGERRRLEIARALSLNPKFLLLDEPFAGVDPLAVDDLQNIVKTLKEKGLGILISDHNVRETLKICDRAYIIHHGEILEEGSPDKIASSSKAKEVYLGKEFYL